VSRLDDWIARNRPEPLNLPVNISESEYNRRREAHAEAMRVYAEKLGWIMSQHAAEIRAALEGADGRWIDGQPAARTFQIKTKED
jgi:hypothetical protein